MFVDAGLSSTISMGVWIVFAIYLIFAGKLVFRSNVQNIVLFLLYFLIFVLLMQLLTSKNYLDTSLFSSILLATFILFIGILVGDKINKDTLKFFVTCYIISASIVGIVVFFQSLLGYDITNRIYAYDSKNSTAQILLTATIFILIFKLNTKNFILRIVYFILCVFLLYVILLMKSRATIIAVPIIILAIMWMSKFNKKAVFFVTLGTIAVVIYFLVNESVWESFVDNIVLGGRSGESLDDISSGRSTEWENFPSEFMQHPLFGHGRIKRESVILTALLEYGVLGGIPILFYALSPLIFCVRKLDLKLYEVQSFLLITITYLINGVFEQLAPFGPGVKCYALWFLMGIMMTTKLYNRK